MQMRRSRQKRPEAGSPYDCLDYRVDVEGSRHELSRTPLTLEGARSTRRPCTQQTKRLSVSCSIVAHVQPRDILQPQVLEPSPNSITSLLFSAMKPTGDQLQIE